MSTPKTPPAPPSWWSPKAGIWLAVLFVGAAGFPYIASTTKLLAEGKPVTLDAVKDVAEKDMMKKEKEHAKDDAKKYREIKSLAVGADGTVWSGGKAGIFRMKDGAWQAVPGYADIEAKQISVVGNGSVLVTGKQGVYRHQGDAWTQVYEGEAHTAAESADGTLYVTTKEGLKKKSPGAEWTMMSDGFPVTEDK
ncbi:hypothetical protein EI77_02904 [Prosthecobacter fusiformis]|uniref:Uncharacterized protein n=1 Tax=Prosthecobacter fusiformis TaxID=48464 RepID=A0A4R7RWC4_9BACT|nr:hypothetical protein [Prosthecobacter fusiformis]TDU69256.1 hypothetical protein EI77_02904 [Prosthecobacter fusiformis]